MPDLMPQPKKDDSVEKDYMRPVLNAYNKGCVGLIYVGSTALILLVVLIILYNMGVI